MKKIVFLSLILMLSLSACTKKESRENKTMHNNIRKAVAAGQFYPADKKELKEKIEKYLDEAPEKEIGGEIKAVLVPHAGYEFSGQTAAYGFRQLQGKKFGTAVIICNSHADYFDGMAIDGVDAWETPLGAVSIDKELRQKLIDFNDKIKIDNSVFGKDQVLEVQLPFLQIIFGNEIKILPVYFGSSSRNDYKILSQALAENLGEDDIIIISTDMSHYPAYEDANEVDKGTLEVITTNNVVKLEEYESEVMRQSIAGEQTILCGIDGVKTIMELAGQLGWQAEILKYANSGDSSIGGKDSVVGYGAVAFIERQSTKDKNLSDDKEVEILNILNSEQKNKLLEIAKTTVESFVRDGKIPEFEVSDERLNRKEGAFVTLKKHGELRGCIGQIIPSDKLLWQVVQGMAVAACSEDNRFSPVIEKELADMEYEVSVLSQPKKIDSWQEVELGKHGVIIKRGGQGGVFLPQVADETGWSKEEFLSQLCWQKAGLPSDCYKSDRDVELQIFTAQVF